MKPVTPKKRITSTVILGIILLSLFILIIIFFPISLKEIANSGSSESAEEEGARAIGLIFVYILIIPLLLIASFGAVIIGGICLPFSIRNRLSTLKAVRIISYIYDGLFGLIIILGIIKSILIFLGM